MVDHSNTQTISQVLDIAHSLNHEFIVFTKLVAVSHRFKLDHACLPHLFYELVMFEALPSLHHPHDGRLCVKLPVLLY